MMKLEERICESKKDIREGQITVYLALMLVLILSLVCTTIEGVRLEGAKLIIQNIMNMGIESIFAEYNKDLLEDYDLFFVDSGYGLDSSYVIDNKMFEYVKKNYDTGVNIASINAAQIYRVDCESLSIDKRVIATDDSGGAYYSQVVNFMKSQVGINTLKEFYNAYCNDTKSKISTFESVESQKDDNLTGLEDAKVQYEEEYNLQLDEANENGTDVELEPPSTESNPLDEVGQYMSMGVLELILGDDISISGKEIGLANLPSYRELKKGNGTYQKKDGLSHKLLFIEYLNDKFKNVTNYTENPEVETVLDYQLEYIYAGKKSDSKNLEAVLKKMLLMREGINLAYLMSDTGKVAQAQALAVALVGYLGVPAFVEGMKYALLVGWAFVESVVEIRGLVNGKKIAMIKSSANWNVNFGEITNFNNIDLKEDSAGVDYVSCLKMLFYMGDIKKITMRSLDVIELEIQRKSGNNNFFVDNCLMKCRACGNWSIDNVFLNLGYRLLAKGEKYEVSTYTEYAYIKGY